MLIKVTGGNIRNGHLYIDRANQLFPSDIWGGNNKLVQGQPITLEFEGLDESIRTDIDGDKRIFRFARGHLKRFFALNQINEGDLVKIEKVGYYHYKIFSVKAHNEEFHNQNNSTNYLSMMDNFSSDFTSSQTTQRNSVTINRIIRDTKLSQVIKNLYDFKCQICGISIKTNQGYYAEAAHIKPLGSPHNGHDSIDNILCLCPNHHVMLDYGAITINPDLSLNGYTGKLNINSNHIIDLENIMYHTELFSKS